LNEEFGMGDETGATAGETGEGAAADAADDAAAAGDGDCACFDGLALPFRPSDCCDAMMSVAGVDMRVLLNEMMAYFRLRLWVCGVCCWWRG